MEANSNLQQLINVKSSNFLHILYFNMFLVLVINFVSVLFNSNTLKLTNLDHDYFSSRFFSTKSKNIHKNSITTRKNTLKFFLKTY